MRKRITALLLCFVLLIAALPIQASAASADEVQRICDQITNVYWQSLSSAGLGTFHGYQNWVQERYHYTDHTQRQRNV